MLVLENSKAKHTQIISDSITLILYKNKDDLKKKFFLVELMLECMIRKHLTFLVVFLVVIQDNVLVINTRF